MYRRTIKRFRNAFCPGYSNYSTPGHYGVQSSGPPSGYGFQQQYGAPMQPFGAQPSQPPPSYAQTLPGSFYDMKKLSARKYLCVRQLRFTKSVLSRCFP